MYLTKGKKIIIGLVIAVAVIGLSFGFYLVRASHNPSFCAACHIIRPYYQSWSQGTLLASKHRQADVRCQDCHKSSYVDKAKEGVKYITGQYETPLPELKVSQQECLKCHGSYEKIAERTAKLEPNPHENPHYGNLECNACHKMHRESKVYCAQCHTFDWI
ncbi:cytochrome c3 family protein [Syntrophothermus sp.]|uniref:cytochrome c3 family protein n=1 Tax=Syntrophothermus sp. TaxID=2736299 RepID=UPI00257B1A8A|nr:cytochrome c3 family protein [Syntrophothermus sp.]